MIPDYKSENVMLFRADCMDFMRETPDKVFDLAIVDPPYGIHGKLYRPGDTGALYERKLAKLYNHKQWDTGTPLPEYWEELFRVSKQQIIWGGNYFPLPPTRGIIWWDKCQPWPNFSAGELAWTSFDKPAAKFEFDNRTSDKIHPTQKPVALYTWLLANYAKPGQRILDTHLGSGSIGVACVQLGFPLTACEIDAEYFAGALERIQREEAQGKLL